MVNVGTYLITNDLVLKTMNALGSTISEDLKNRIRNIGNGFLKGFWSISGIPEDVDRITLDGSYLSNELVKLLRKVEYPIVSLDRIYVPPETSSDLFYIDVTRLTDQATGAVKLAARPGKKSIDEQASELKNIVKNTPVALVDVGAFEGNTLLRVLNTLRKEDIKVAEIYLGVSNRRLNEKINYIARTNVVSTFDLYEWIELRDLIGIDGRKVGVDQKGTLQYIPYWENLTGWASISNENAYIVKQFCIKYYDRLIGLILRELADGRCNNPTLLFGRKVGFNEEILNLIRCERGEEQVKSKDAIKR